LEETKLLLDPVSVLEKTITAEAETENKNVVKEFDKITSLPEINLQYLIKMTGRVYCIGVYRAFSRC
jgi:hypothetical protein